MSPVRFEVVPGAELAQVRARYLPSDYALLVGRDGEAPVAAHRLSIGTVTLSFDPRDHRLIGLDAYTNIDRWTRESLTLPSAVEQGKLVCLEPFDQHGIARGDDATPAFTWDERARILHVGLEAARETVCVRCLSQVVGELGSKGELTALWIENLEVE